MLEDKQPKRTPLSELGEFGLIEHLTKEFKLKNSNSVFGVGDDCAVIDAGAHYQLVTTDMLIEGIHFDLTYTPLKHLGYKAVVVNLSDVFAMNGLAQQITRYFKLFKSLLLHQWFHVLIIISFSCSCFRWSKIWIW